jgi:hypothetical protein
MSRTEASCLAGTLQQICNVQRSCSERLAILLLGQRGRTRGWHQLTLDGPVHIRFNVRPERCHITPSDGLKDGTNMIGSNHIEYFESVDGYEEKF